MELELSETGDSGSGGEYPPVDRVVEIDEDRVLGAWADQGHLPAHDVDELRKLVDAVAAEDASDARHPGIVGRGQPGSGTAHDHRPDLEDRDDAAMLAYPSSAVQE